MAFAHVNMWRAWEVTSTLLLYNLVEQARGSFLIEHVIQSVIIYMRRTKRCLHLLNDYILFVLNYFAVIMSVCSFLENLMIREGIM